MCRHANDTVDELATRQRGLDARGNDRLATKRESSFAVSMLNNASPPLIGMLTNYAGGLAQRNDVSPVNAPLLGTALGQLNNPTPVAFTEMLLNNNNGFKRTLDDIGNSLNQQQPPAITPGAIAYKKARALPIFADRGRNDLPPRSRRASISNRDAGITTGTDRTADTQQVFAANVAHAKGQNRAVLDSETYAKFQKSGTPFIAGASGTVMALAADMENKKPFAQLNAQEIRDRERMAALLAAQLVAAGHHSMGECLMAAKIFGYFKDVPDPLVDYDAAMKALEAHLVTLGIAPAQPLSRESANFGNSKEQIAYEDKKSAVESLLARYVDQLGPQQLTSARNLMRRAAVIAGPPGNDYAKGWVHLGQAESVIRGGVAQITAAATGNNNVLRPDELVARMKGAPKKGKKDSVEYKAVQSALAEYEKASQEIGGRKLDHDAAAMAFEELRAALAKAKKGAQDYIAKHGTKKGERRGVMADLVAKIDAEIQLLAKAERVDPNETPQARQAREATEADLTIRQAVEYSRFDVDLATQARPGVLKESRITRKAALGAGNVNAVTEIDYAAAGGNAAETRVFKPEQKRIPAMPTGGDLVGLDPNNPRAGKKNIASGKMAAAMGLGAMLPTPEFTTVDGVVGLAMPKATGKAPVKMVPVRVDNPQNVMMLQQAVDAKNRGEADWKTKMPATLGGMKLTYDDQSGEFRKDDANARVMPLKAPPADAAKAAAMQQQLVDLQWLDALTGQIDRHQENYLVDTSGATPRITAIDNDAAFGATHDNPNMQVGKNVGLPPVIDRATYDSLMAINWTNFAATLAKDLEPAEIAAAKNRFDAVRAQLAVLNNTGMVIDDWQNGTVGPNATVGLNAKSIADFLTSDDAPESYFKREARLQQALVNAQKVVND